MRFHRQASCLPHGMMLKKTYFLFTQMVVIVSCYCVPERELMSKCFGGQRAYLSRVMSFIIKDAVRPLLSDDQGF